MDDFFNPPEDHSDDFLKREREALGGEFGATVTAGGADHDFESSAAAFPDLDAGDELGSFTSAPAAPAGLNAAARTQVSVTGANEFAAFENEYPALEEEVPAPVQHIQNGFGTATPSYQQQPSLFQGTPAPVEEESEFLKSWKVKQAEEIARREEASAKKKEETIIKAQNAIDNFYKDYSGKKEKNIAKNKEEEAAFNEERTDALAKGTVWERVCTLVELQDSRSKTATKSKQDLVRFKEILLALKREGDAAPGAKGY
ncbi:hypothetical protein T439DRAFT_324809 [Meredithblackwellia eburnea MCA 4105]